MFRVCDTFIIIIYLLLLFKFWNIQCVSLNYYSDGCVEKSQVQFASIARGLRYIKIRHSDRLRAQDSKNAWRLEKLFLNSIFSWMDSSWKITVFLPGRFMGFSRISGFLERLFSVFSPGRNLRRNPSHISSCELTPARLFAEHGAFACDSLWQGRRLVWLGEGAAGTPTTAWKDSCRRRKASLFLDARPSRRLGERPRGRAPIP